MFIVLCSFLFVFLDAGCLIKTFTHIYGPFFFPLQFKIYHTLEFISQLFNSCSALSLLFLLHSIYIWSEHCSCEVLVYKQLMQTPLMLVQVHTLKRKPYKMPSDCYTLMIHIALIVDSCIFYL